MKRKVRKFSNREIEPLPFGREKGKSFGGGEINSLVGPFTQRGPMVIRGEKNRGGRLMPALICWIFNEEKESHSLSTRTEGGGGASRQRVEKEKPELFSWGMGRQGTRLVHREERPRGLKMPPGG